MASPQARQTIESGAADPVRWLLAGLQTRSIIRAALLEGAAIFNVFAYMTERQPYSMVIAVALLLSVFGLISLVSTPLTGPAGAAGAGLGFGGAWLALTVGAIITGIWILYRVIRGWMALRDGRSLNV
jgi:uncharacterized membrane protein